MDQRDNLCGAAGEMMADDSDLALEQQLHFLGDGGSSDSEGDTCNREGSRSRAVSDVSKRSVPTRELLERMEPDRLSEAGSLLSNSSTSPPRLNRNLPLNAIFDNQKAFEQFRRFLQDQCITRNLSFWLACKAFKDMDPTVVNLKALAEAIYVKFIKLSAPQHVTISKNTKRSIKMSLEMGRGPITSNLFNEAQQEIWEIMSKNEMRQFLVSDNYKECSMYQELKNVPELFTPGMAAPAYGVCGGGSLQNSASEDSASVTTDSEVGAKSAVFHPSSRSLNSSNPRRAVSDTEGSRPKKSSRRVFPDAYITAEHTVSKEEFAMRIRERLQAVFKDREAMTQKARDMLRQQGKTYEEIMAAQWYDLPESYKYLLPASVEDRCTQDNSRLRPSSAHHILSPLDIQSPASTLCSGASHLSHREAEHISSLAVEQVESALREFQVTNQVNMKRSQKQTTSGCSSVLSATSDSGVGEWGTSGLVTPTNDRLHAYLQHQNMFASRQPERDRNAQAAAIALISNSPQPDSLNPRLPPPVHQHHQNEDRHRRHNMTRYSSTDDSSSVFTMTSQSTTSDLFIPRRTPLYPESDEPHHFATNRYRRTLSTPRRSQHMKNSHVPSPLAEQQHRPPPQQRPPHHHSSGGDILIVYNLENLDTPYAKRLSGSNVTLGDFKERVFARKGNYRFFFKSFCEDLGMETFMEYMEDGEILPLTGGKIIGRVEKA